MMVTGILSVPYGAIEPLRRCGPAIQQQTFAPVTDSTRFSNAIATRHTHRPIGGGLLDMTLLARPTTGAVVQILQRQHHFSVTVRPRINFTVVQGAHAKASETVRRLGPVFIPPLSRGGARRAGGSVRQVEPPRRYAPPLLIQGGESISTHAQLSSIAFARNHLMGWQAPVPAARALSVPPAAQALPDLLPRLEVTIGTELVYRRLTERVEEATSEKLVRRLVAREQRIEPTVLRKNLPPRVVWRGALPSPPVSSESRHGGQPTTDPMRQASFPSSGPQRQIAPRRGEPSQPAAMVPPLNISQLADEVLTVIDRRLVAARERLGKR